MTVTPQGSKEDRLDWRESQKPVCWICGSTRGLQVHHIEYRSAAPRRYDVPWNLFLTCLKCHATIHGEGWVKPRVLAMKMIHDPENYDLAKWLLIKHPEDSEQTRVTQAEVDWWITARETTE
jgi:hypothetical protein